MRLTKKMLDKLPTVRLYVSETAFFTVPYMNAPKTIKLPLALKDFKPNGRGVPWICGVSNAALRQKDLFNYPVHLAHTIGSVVYVVAALNKNGFPKVAYRYRHHGGSLVDAYDRSRKDPSKAEVFFELLTKRPYVVLEKGRSEAGKGSHSPGEVSGHRHPEGLNGDKNKTGLIGAAKRAAAAGLIPEGLIPEGLFEAA